MKKAILVVEFIENDKVDFAILFAGVMDEKHIYVKRISGGYSEEVEYIQLLIENTTDATDDWSGMPEGIPIKTIELPAEVGLDDPRIDSMPFISEEVKNELLQAVSLV